MSWLNNVNGRTELYRDPLVTHGVIVLAPDFLLKSAVWGSIILHHSG